MTRDAVFLDRDGVLVEEIFYPQFGETEAPICPEDVKLLPGVAAATLRLKELGFLLIVISNQGAAAKGKAKLADLWRTQRRFLELLHREGVVLDDELYSFSHPNGVVPGLSGPSLDRKPSPYHLLIAAARWDIDLGRSWMVGDRATDVACGQAAGVRTIRVGSETDRVADHRAQGLTEAVEIIAGTVLANSSAKRLRE